jgi:hypothetical protein
MLTGIFRGEVMPKFEVTGTRIENLFIVITAHDSDDAWIKAEEIPINSWSVVGGEFTVDYVEEHIEEE